MVRRFSEANGLLNDLLDRYEGGTANPIAHPDYDAFPNVVAADVFLRQIARAEAVGAVSLARGRGTRRDQIVHVRLQAADALYHYLGRVPAAQIAQEAGRRLCADIALDWRLVEAAAAIAETWGRAKSWHGFASSDVDKLRDAFALAQAILENRHLDVDYRTFSRRTVGDSKALERVEGAVVRLLGGILELPPGARPREALRTIGLERFAPPLLIAGRIDLDGADLSQISPLYLGIPPKEADRIRFRRPPAYLLTIENFASFNRHVAEADPDREGATMYVGGYPSLATQQALRTITQMLSGNTPIFHWSDIDPDGTWIFHTIERAVGRPIRPHLMSVEIAERSGQVPLRKAAPARCPPDSGIAVLAAYLAGDGAKTLEQEELNPVLPDPTAPP
ncbi:Wadjet anti-phage system protein JetD domain-containing protein [Bradyrhizobium sp. USDA 3458]|uniref:Wadjet anti-phage system protein JetD domain-containing protein n=1 Tax=Bradyrhizobium sp. USDA 3458 TaxID=2591461 RepID=UPI0011430DFA|nr:Wadjet anti-phage system protein JetD domain-containing protein [Bradyrhizobium sp. USDA 3458]